MEIIDRKEFCVWAKSLETNGINSDHFIIGFSSINSLSKIPSGVKFYCHGTYKIVKLWYALIVFVAKIQRLILNSIQFQVY